MAKKLLAILAALCLVAAMGSVGASAVIGYDPNIARTVFFANDIGFHILVIPDAHQTGTRDTNLIAYIESAIKYMAEQNTPLDLVIFLGDAVTGTANTSAAAIATSATWLVEPIRAAGIPYTVVFGDEDCGSVSRAEVLQIWRDVGGTIPFTYQEEVVIADGPPPETAMEDVTVNVRLFAEPSETAAGATGTTNFMYEINRKIYTCSVWNRETFDSHTNGKPNTFLKFVPFARLFLFDIGAKAAGQSGAPYVQADQLQFFTDINTDPLRPVLPAFVFQHIPLPEVYSGGYFLKSPFNLDLPWTTNILGTNYCGSPNYVNMTGVVLETEKAPHFSAQEFEKLTAKGNVPAVFFGHNPKNNFVASFANKGIDLVQLPGAAWNGASGTYLTRGATWVSIRPSTSGGVTYGSDLLTYRQASRVGGSKVGAVNKGFNDWIQIVPYLFKNLLIGLLTPIRWIF